MDTIDSVVLDVLDVILTNEIVKKILVEAANCNDDDEAVHLYANGTVGSGTDYASTDPPPSSHNPVILWWSSITNLKDVWNNANLGYNLSDVARIAGEKGDVALRNTILLLTDQGERLAAEIDAKGEWDACEGEPDDKKRKLAIIPCWNSVAMITRDGDVLVGCSEETCREAIQMRRLDWISQSWDGGRNEISPLGAMKEILHSEDVEWELISVYTHGHRLNSKQLKDLADRMERYQGEINGV